MKRAFIVSLILVLLVSLLAASQVVKLGTANPLWLLFFPRAAVETPPTITFQSPTNRTYDSDNVWLNFTIVKPESWFGVAINIYPSNYVYVNITSLSYTIDGNVSESIQFRDFNASLVEENPERSLNFSTKLTLPEGPHNLTVNLQCDSYYVETFTRPYLSNTQMNFTSEAVYFNVAAANASAPTMLVMVPATSIAAIGIGVLLYFKKHKR
jgi:hypothetical protein